MQYFTRVLSKNEDFPSFEELEQLIQAEHTDYKLILEEGSHEEWETLLLSGNDEVEVALIERYPVMAGSFGEEEIAELIDGSEECNPESAVEWLHEYLGEVKTVYTFQPLLGATTEEGSNVIHALRSMLWERGDSIIQADGEGFTNEEGFHILWQFSDSVSGPWSMGVLQDGVWHHFKMDLGDPDHRDAFMAGEVPADLSEM